MQAVGLWQPLAQWSNFLSSHRRVLQLNVVTTPALRLQERAFSGPAGQLLRQVPIHQLKPSLSCPSAPTAQSVLAPLRSLPHPFPHFRIRSSISIGQRRHISIFRSSPTPSPLAIVRIARLEADANSSPTNVAKQVTLFRALVDANIKECYSRLMVRWERTCSFDPTNPLIRSDDAFQLYVTALLKSNLTDSIPSAVVRREQILAIPVPGPTSTATATDTEPPSPAPPPPSRSQQIADAVLADPVPYSSLLGSVGAASKAVSPDLSNASTVDTFLTPGGRTNPVHVVVEEAKGSLLWKFARFVFIVALYGFVVLTILSLFLENSGLLKAGPTTAEFEPVEGKTVTFSDVHGVDEAKDELQDIVEFLKDPSTFSTLGGRLPKGVLLTGPPGTGKTMLARAVAGEAGVPFFFASGSEFDEVFVGVGAKRIRELFAAARKKQPSIIFIDELDAIGGKRNAKDQHYMKQTLNQMLVELDGFSQTDGVIVIAATNFPQSLDQALVRPGRFDRKIAVPLPDVKGRVQILKHHMKNVITDPTVDATIIARGTPGFSGADLQNMVNQAAVKASREGVKTVQLQHFEWAKDRIVMGAERKSALISPEDKKMTAYHEGGHALAALYTEGAMPLHKVTCMPRGHALGVTTQLPEGDQHSISYDQYLAMIDVSMGGRAAEELIYGRRKVTSGCSSDLEKASTVARNMVKYFGFSEKLGPIYYPDDNAAMLSPQKKDEIENEVRSLVEGGNSRVLALLKSKELELHRLADALVEYETLDLHEVNKVIAGEKIRVDEDLSKIEV